MWTEDDLELALAWKADDKLICDSCGHHLDETLQDDAVRSFEAIDLICHACEVIEWRRKALSDQDSEMAGIRIFAKRRHADGR